MLSPSSLTRESMTCVSGELQNGHFIQMADGGWRMADGKSGSYPLSPSAIRHSPFDLSPVHRIFIAQLLDLDLHAVDCLVLAAGFEHVGDEMGKLLGLDLGEAA